MLFVMFQYYIRDTFIACTLATTEQMVIRGRWMYTFLILEMIIRFLGCVIHVLRAYQLVVEGENP